MQVEVIESLIEKYQTSQENIEIVNSILDICYVEKSKRISSKRSLEYINKYHHDLYLTLVDDVPFDKIGEIIKYHIYNKTIPKCKTCNDKNIIIRAKLNENFDYCSNACTIKSKEVQEKTAKTCDEKYGKRFNYENKEKYDFGTHHLHKNIKNIDDINNDDFMKSLQIKGDWKSVAKHFGLSLNSHTSAFKFMRDYGYDIDHNNGTSNIEKEVYDYVVSLVGDDKVLSNTKQVITPYELDIYIPEYKLAIEFNGLYWHSSDSMESDKVIKNKHLNKTNLCEEKGVNLLHIFENEWLDEVKKEIWKSVISSKLNRNKKIYARKCIVKDITSMEARLFCEENHLQGYSVSKKCKGLFYDEELVMVATLSKSRYNKEYTQELIRLCAKKYINIVGGASKLLHGEKYISYANRRWSYGNVYDKLNMTRLKVTEPCYYYFKNRENKLYHRSSFMKHKLKDKLSDYDENKTEVDNMYNNNYRRIWDCGTILYSN